MNGRPLVSKTTTFRHTTDVNETHLETSPCKSNHMIHNLRFMWATFLIARFVVFTAMKILGWMQCSNVVGYRRFGGPYCQHLRTEHIHASIQNTTNLTLVVRNLPLRWIASPLS